jgi:hypothetical protein
MINACIRRARPLKVELILIWSFKSFFAKPEPYKAADPDLLDPSWLDCRWSKLDVLFDLVILDSKAQYDSLSIKPLSNLESLFGKWWEGGVKSTMLFRSAKRSYKKKPLA